MTSALSGLRVTLVPRVAKLWSVTGSATHAGRMLPIGAQTDMNRLVSGLCKHWCMGLTSSLSCTVGNTAQTACQFARHNNV